MSSSDGDDGALVIAGWEICEADDGTEYYRNQATGARTPEPPAAVLEWLAAEEQTELAGWEEV